MSRVHPFTAYLLVLLSVQAVHGQAPTFTLNGLVKSHDTGMLMPGTTIVVKDTVDAKGLEYRVNTHTDRRGKYKLSLPYDGIYSVEYQAQDHVTKRLIIDLTDVRPKDRVDGNAVSLAIDLFPFHNQVDYSIFDEPIAVGRFDHKQKTLLWDEAYSKARLEGLEAVDRTQEAVLRSMQTPAPAIH